MNDEIKEILDYLNEFIKSDKVEQIYLNQKRVKQLLDYITNLQEENERLSKEVDMWNRKYNEQIDIINELEKWSEEYRFTNILKDKLKELKEGK